MTEPTDTDSRAERAASPRVGMPRWVKVFLVVAAVLVVLLIALMVISGGQHGPGRHFSSTAPAGPRAAGTTHGSVGVVW